MEEMQYKRKCLTNVRGLGMMNAVDVVSRAGKLDARLRNRILQEAFRRGLILMGSGYGTIRFCPPLCINDVQVEVALKLFDEAIATVI